MKKIINTCFGTTKKAILSATCIAAATAALGGAAYASTAANTSTGNSVIGEAQAQEYAFSDAGIDAADAANIVTEYEYEDGQYIYDVEFTTDDTEFEYWVSAVDGTILKKSAGVIAGTVTDNEATANGAEANGAEANAGTESSANGAEANTGTESSANGAEANTGTESSAAAAEVTLEDAKELALSDAGVAAADATFEKAMEDTDDGVAVFDIEFYTSSTEYEYEIRVSDGKIVDKSQEARKTGSTSSGTSSNSSGSTGSSYISVDKAKEIALNKAGLSASQVTFQKAMLDKEDGVVVYEVEFYKGNTEYECTINAATGAIIEFDVDTDDD